MNRAYTCGFVQIFSLVSVSLKIINGFSFRKQLVIVATHKTAPRPENEKWAPILNQKMYFGVRSKLYKYMKLVNLQSYFQ